MKNCNTKEQQSTRGILNIACVTVLGMAVTLALPQAAHAQIVTPPPVPAGLQVPAGNEAFLLGRGVGGMIRVTWQASRDTSIVWARAIASVADPNASGAIAWLLLQVVGTKLGPTGGNTLSGTTFIQRLNTVGGSAPATGCDLPTDIGRKAFVPYTADYFSYKKN
jgi:Protein of unknown function (DUF3455)